MELTKTKPICTELKCGNGVSQETNESFDFLITIRIFGLRIVNWMKNIFLLHQENNHFLFFLPSPLRISVVSCPGFFFFPATVLWTFCSMKALGETGQSFTEAAVQYVSSSSFCDLSVPELRSKSHSPLPPHHQDRSCDFSHDSQQTFPYLE